MDNELPTELLEIMQIEGFSLKSATLTLQNFHDKPHVIDVDRHLERAFHNLHWANDVTTDYESAKQVSQWLPENEHVHVVNVIARINQLLQPDKTRSIQNEGHSFR